MTLSLYCLYFHKTLTFFTHIISEQSDITSIIMPSGCDEAYSPCISSINATNSNANKN